MAPPPRCKQQGNLVLHRQEHSAQVDCDHAVPVVVGRVGQGGSAGPLDAGIVERHVDPAVGVHRDIEGSLHLAGVGDVATDGDGLAAGFGDEPGGFGVGLLVGVGDDYRGAFAGEREGGGAADAAGGTGDEGNVVGEPAVLVGHDVPLVAGREWPVGGVRRDTDQECSRTLMACRVSMARYPSAAWSSGSSRSNTLPGWIWRFRTRSIRSGRNRRTGAGPPCRWTWE
jgi:hypothetical protein